MLKYAMIAAMLILAVPGDAQSPMARYGQALVDDDLKCAARYGEQHKAACLWAKRSITNGGKVFQEYPSDGNPWLDLWKK